MCLSFPLTSMEYHDVSPNISLSRRSVMHKIWSGRITQIQILCHLLPFAKVGQHSESVEPKNQGQTCLSLKFNEMQFVTFYSNNFYGKNSYLLTRHCRTCSSTCIHRASLATLSRGQGCNQGYWQTAGSCLLRHCVTKYNIGNALVI